MTGRLALPPMIALALSGVIGVVALLPAGPEAPVPLRASRELRAAPEPDGAIALLDAETGTVAGTVPAEGDSFVRGVLSSMGYARRRHAVPDGTPFRLLAYADGRVVLLDPSSGTRVDMRAFGPDNNRAFAVLLPSPEEAPR